MPITTAKALLFRPRRAMDDAFIARLSVSAFGEYAKNPEWTTLEMAHRGTTWLAWRGDRPLGFAIYEGSGPLRANLTAIAVDEEARGTGVASALLAQVDRQLSASGTRELTLITAVANVSALELFLKRGFRVIRRLPRVYRGVFDACELGKRVGSASR